MPSVIERAMTALLGQQKKSSTVVERVRKFLGREIAKREEWERQAYVNVMLREGHHWVNDQGLPDNRDPNQLRRHVNKFKAVGRGLKNSIVFNDPIVEVMPDNGELVDQRELDVAVAIIRNEFNMAGEESEGMKDMLRTVVDEAAHKSFVAVSVMPNNDASSPRINDIRVHDSFDVFFDSHNLRKAQIAVISSWESKDFLEAEGFENVMTTGDGKVRSHSSLKNEFERLHGKEGLESEDHVLVDNVYYVEHERDDAGKIKSDSKPKILSIVLAGDTVLREPEELKGFHHLGQLFFLYYLERNRFVKYPTPWMTELVPLQRSLNDASENIDTLIHWIAKVRLMQREGASNTVQLIGDRHVQKLRYSGEKPQFMEFPSIPQDLFRQVQMRENQIEDMVGIHAASLGRSSGDRVSGRKEAVLAAGDSDNVAEPVRNLETFLSRLFAQVLENASDNMTKVQKITGSAGDTFESAGEEAIRKMRSKEKKKNLVAVRPFKNIKVTIVPGSNALIAQGRQEILQLMPVLVNAGMTEQAEALFDVLMRMYAVGTARDIAKVIEQKREEGEAENPELMQAKAEVNILAQGKTVTATPEQPHDVHVQLKLTALQTLLQQGAAQKSDDDPVFAAFMSNISQHESMMQRGSSPKMGMETMITGVTK